VGKARWRHADASLPSECTDDTKFFELRDYHLDRTDFGPCRLLRIGPGFVQLAIAFSSQIARLHSKVDRQLSKAFVGRGAWQPQPTADSPDA
jgi:hypothetical protein